MRKLYDYVFHVYPPIKNSMEGDHFVITLHTIGGCLIAVTFLIWGLTCVIHAFRSAQANKKARVRVTYLFGTFLILCSLSRLVEVMCMWHALQVINAVLKVCTGGISAIALFYLPHAVRFWIRNRTIEEVHQEVEETNKKIDTALTVLGKQNKPDNL